MLVGSCHGEEGLSCETGPERNKVLLGLYTKKVAHQLLSSTSLRGAWISDVATAISRSAQKLLFCLARLVQN